MTSMTDALGRTTGFVPTSNGSISRLQFPGGTAYNFTLDSSGNKTSQVVRGADGKVNAYQTFTYNSNGDIASQTDYLVPSGATEISAATKLRENVFTYNAEGETETGSGCNCLTAFYSLAENGAWHAAFAFNPLGLITTSWLAEIGRFTAGAVRKRGEAGKALN